VLRVVDVSNNNGHVDFAKVKADGADGVWLKVTEGIGFVDPDYESNRAAAKAAGLKVGGYHFGHPQNNAQQELGFFLAHLKLERGDLLPALDLETADSQSWARVGAFGLAFLHGLARRIGDRPVLYAGEYFMSSSGLLHAPFPKWVPDYGARPQAYDAWQYTDGQAKYGPPIDGLDTSYVPHLSVVTYKAPKHKRAVARVKKKAKSAFWILTHRLHPTARVWKRWWRNHVKQVKSKKS
jgi:GH25 family lysozyme M1 (1,4-beta-N-acetylmuramidase)